MISKSFCYSSLILTSFLVLVFSFNFHAIWLIYDFSLILILILYPLINNIKFKYYEWLFIIITFFYFLFIAFLSKNFLISILSIWDIFKHLILVIPLWYFFNTSNKMLKKSFFMSDNFLKFIIFTFFIQLFFASYQFFDGYYYDNISGTFGNGASHSIAYFSLLVLIVCFLLKIKLFWLVIIILSIILINILSDNIGFPIFFVAISFFILKNTNAFKYKFILPLIAVCLLLPLIFFLIDTDSETKSFFIKVFSRTQNFIYNLSTNYSYEISHSMGRVGYMIYAFELGNLIGNSPGSYSNIYMLEGYDYPLLLARQININQVSISIAEYGLVGILIIFLLYALILLKFIDKYLNKIFVFIYMLILFFYTSVLATESQALIFILSIFYLGMFLKNESNDF